MNPGDVGLISLPQFRGGPAKLRPALVLALLPGPYQSILLCGISSQLQHLTPDWDEPIHSGDSDFSSSGLHQASLIRLSYLYSADPSEVLGSIGRIDETRLERLLTRLADHLHP